MDTRAAAVEAKALELGLIDEGEAVDNAARAQAVLAIATEQSTFAIGDAARTAEGAANQFKFLSRDWEEISTTAGDIMLPIVEVVLAVFTDMAAMARENSENWDILAKVLALPVQAFFAIEKAISNVQIKLLDGTAAILEMVQSANDLLGSFSPFPNLGNKVQRAIDQIRLKSLQAKDSVKKWDDRQEDLNKALKSFKGSADKATKSTDKLIRPTKKLGKEIVKVEEGVVAAKKAMDDWIAGVNRSLNPSQDLIDKFFKLADEGKTTKEMLFILGDQIDSTVDDLREMGREIPNEIEAMLAMRNSIVDISGLAPALDILSASAGRAETRLGDLGAITEETAKKIIDEGRPSVEEWAESIRDNNRAVGELGDGFSDFLGGIDSDIVPGVGRIKAVFDSVMNTITGFFDTLTSIIGLFSEGGPFAGVLSGLNRFADIFGGGEDGGGLGGLFGGLGGGGGGGGGLTTSFTELAITGVAIQTGIFATGVSLTGITIQTGEFRTGVSLSGITIGNIFGGGGKGTEIAFNTRLLLGWVEDHFPVFVKNQEIGINTTQEAVNILTNLLRWAEFHGQKLSTIADKTSSLFGIQQNRIAPAIEAQVPQLELVADRTGSILDVTQSRVAPAVEFIASQFPININVSVNTNININESKSPERTAKQIVSQIGGGGGDLPFLDAIRTNRSGIRSAIQDIT